MHGGPLRIFTTDGALARKLSPGLRIGTRFIFLDLQQCELNVSDFDISPDLQIHSESRYQFTIPLPRSEKVSLPGVSLEAKAETALSLVSLTVDRDIYRFLTDVVHVLVVDLDHPIEKRNIVLRSGGMVIEEREAFLDENGVAQVRFQELPIGEYEVTFQDDCGDTFCCFRVAAFELAPLVAKLGSFSLSGKVLSLKLNLQRFGAPYNGDLRVDLLDDEQRIDCQFASAREGLAFVRLELTGDGPHRLEVFLRGDSTATANISLPGSRREEREETLLSQCGPRFTASLMPGKDTEAVRDLHIAKMDSAASPVCLHEVHRSRVRLEAMDVVDDCCVIVDHLGGNRGNDGECIEGAPGFYRFSRLVSGDTVEIDVPSPGAILSIGGFVDGKPWEARAVTVAPSKIVPKLQLKVDRGRLLSSEEMCGSVKAGSPVTVRVETDGSQNGSVALLVKDARLASSDRPELQLARNLKQVCEAANVGAIGVESLDALTYRSHPRWLNPSVAPAIPIATLQKLVERQVLTAEQANDVSRRAQEATPDVFATIVSRRYADPASICRGLADIHGWSYVALEETTIAEDLLLECPESVARESQVIPVSLGSDGTLTFAFANPFCLNTLDKLQFILNRRLGVAVSAPDLIRGAIDYYYGCVETESADTMLQEFTDTAIDFTDTVEAGLSNITDLSADEPIIPQAIREESRVLFCDLVPLINGIAEVEITLPEEPDSYLIDAFTASAGDWAHGTLSFESTADPYVKLQVPEMLYRGDLAEGRVVARALSGIMKVEVTRDGESVPLRATGRNEISVSDGYCSANELELFFEVLPGNYQARVIDGQTQEVANSSKRVSCLGELTQLRRVPCLLEPGERIEINDEIRRIDILPGLKSIQLRTAKATAHYDHLCCEQTAAKLFASLVSLALAEAHSAEFQSALQAAHAGLQRLKAMWIPGEGFAFYLGQPPNRQWGAIATRHLLQIDFLDESLTRIPVAGLLLSELKRLQRNASHIYGIAWPPRSVSNCWEAYAALRYSVAGVTDTALELARHQNRKWQEKSRVYQRNGSAFAAACLLRSGQESDVATALGWANQLFEELEPEGRLYSTLDSAGLIALINELARRECPRSDARVMLNGRSISLREAHECDAPIESFVAEDVEVPMELFKWHHVDWTQVERQVPLSIQLMGHRNQDGSFLEGSQLTLRLGVCDGYSPGDLLWIALPPCLSRLEGGGQVKQFSVDLQGSDTAEVRLVATGPSFPPWMTPASQHFLVCLRNMYEEERVGNPGPIEITVVPSQRTEVPQP